MATKKKGKVEEIEAESPDADEEGDVEEEELDLDDDDVLEDIGEDESPRRRRRR